MTEDHAATDDRNPIAFPQMGGGMALVGMPTETPTGTVHQGSHTATLYGTQWRSDNASFALWLNNTATSVADALLIGCLEGAAPAE